MLPHTGRRLQFVIAGDGPTANVWNVWPAIWAYPAA